MYYNTFHDLKLSALGFGAMRLPLIQGSNELADVDFEQTKSLVSKAFRNGINYFDTGYPYHGGKSEAALAYALADFPRKNYYLATKFPGHMIYDTYEPDKIFHEQLQRLNTDYIDFYLLHNVNEGSVLVYNDPKWKIIDYFINQKKLGNIRFLGFSAHARYDTLDDFLSLYPGVFDFCQIQLNYLDISLQNADKKLEVLRKHGIPVWVMEPVRGGKLSVLPEESEARLKALRPDDSIPSWAFRFVQSQPDVIMTLSGMSTVEQLEDNLKTYHTQDKLSKPEIDLLYDIAEGLKDSIPCTFCRYCCEVCPQKLNIPGLIAMYNEMKVSFSFTPLIQLEALEENQRPSSCLGCGLCTKVCPQNINIPEIMKETSERFDKMPRWSDICKARMEKETKK